MCNKALNICAVLLVVILHQSPIDIQKGVLITGSLFTQLLKENQKAIIILELEVLLLHGLQEVIVKRLITLVTAHLELIVLGLEVDITALIAQVQKDIFHDKLYKL
ncbi:hypothetical protein AXA63_04310 [Acinetobacter baumannii]|nr:hypothetical protein AXA63_04310 [Acinetobacter baumannii]